LVCPVEPNTNLFDNPSFRLAGNWTISEYQVESENLVKSLLKREPSYNVYARDSVEQNTLLKPWSRPLAGWSLECESEGLTRLQAFTDIYSKKFDSKSTTQHLGFMAIGVCAIAFAIFFQCVVCFGGLSQAAPLAVIGYVC